MLDVSLLGNKKSHTRNGLRLLVPMCKTWLLEFLLIWRGIAENYLGVIICVYIIVCLLIKSNCCEK